MRRQQSRGVEGERGGRQKKEGATRKTAKPKRKKVKKKGKAPETRAPPYPCLRNANTATGGAAGCLSDARVPVSARARGHLETLFICKSSTARRAAAHSAGMTLIIAHPARQTSQTSRQQISNDSLRPRHTVPKLIPDRHPNMKF